VLKGQWCKGPRSLPRARGVIRGALLKLETRWFACILVAFLFLNAVTLTRYPAVGTDEVQFADPAVRFASGLGFTSTAWHGQDSSRFWAGNAPLYSGLLAFWLCAVGCSQFAVRWLNIV
jgi:hypothetical protein